MTWEWHIGDPVDDATGGSMDAQNWGRRSDDDEDNNSTDYNNSKRDSYSKKAWDQYMDFKDEEALYYINLALNLDNNNANNWNIKAIILESLKRFGESEECYNKSLNLESDSRVSDNKTRMQYTWSSQLLEESKKLPNGLDKLDEAMEKITKAINARPGDNSEENLDKYLNMRDNINFYINYEKEFQKNIKKIISYSKEELFTIAGISYHKSNVELNPGMSLKLVKEPNNEFDSDAIAVYAEGEKIGYVANGVNTKYELTSSASQLNDRIPDTSKGLYLCYLNRYSDIEFHIARIIR